MLSNHFQKRREHLMRQMSPKSAAIITAAPEILQGDSSAYHYRQNSDFYYLTGFTEPEAVAVFLSDQDGSKFILFNRPRDNAQEIWTGLRAGQEGACLEYGANYSYPIKDIDEVMPQILANVEHIYCDLGLDVTFDTRLMSWLRQLRKKVREGFNESVIFLSLEQIVYEMRLIKDAEEIALMRKAAAISSQAHLRAMQMCRPGINECDIEAEILYEFIRNGCRSPAYTTIVGSGKNSCILHYDSNNQILQNNELVLIDAGCEYNYYASDITRTLPINGRFTPEQRAIYEIVLAAQLAGIKEVRPGNPWPRIQEVIIPIITEGLRDLGILTGSLKKLIADRAYFNFYMHNSGHWLGLNTHDVGSYRKQGKWRNLTPGMVLTVEPGIYIMGNNPNVDAKWWNIGVRIEDDVLVTADGCDVLSQALPKSISDIEAVMVR
jgi:Xaa-Pro aminopeptidase